MNSIQMINADMFEYVKTLEDDSVDLFYVDPPYFINYKEWDGIGLDFDTFFHEFMKLIITKLKDNGSMWIFMAKDNIFPSKNKNVKTGLVQILEEYGTVHLDNWVTWKRQKGRGAKHKLKSLREEIFHFTKHPKNYTFNHVEMLREVVTPYVKDGRPRGWFIDESTGMRVRWTGLGNIFCYSSPQWNGKLDKQRHPAQKPFLLIERLILLSSNEGDLVVDPFMGSGAAASVCKYHNRRYIGIEKDEKIFNDAKNYFDNNYDKIKIVYEESIHRVNKVSKQFTEK